MVKYSRHTCKIIQVWEWWIPEKKYVVRKYHTQHIDSWGWGAENSSHDLDFVLAQGTLQMANNLYDLEDINHKIKL